MLKITAGLRVKYLSLAGTQRAGTDKNAMASNRSELSLCETLPLHTIFS